jgi:hypothetical protein
MLHEANGFQFCSALSTELFHLIHRINNQLFVLLIHCKSNNELAANCLRYLTEPTKPSALILKQLICHETRYDQLSMGSDRLYALYFTLSNQPTNKLRGFSPRANYTDRATAACRRS